MILSRRRVGRSRRLVRSRLKGREMTHSIAMLAEHHVRKGRALVSWQSLLVEDLARRQDNAMLLSAHALLVQLRIALNEMEARARYLSGGADQIS